MNEVAGIVISYGACDLSHFGVQVVSGQEFADIFYFGAKGLSASGIFWVVTQQVPIFFEVRTTASRVNNYCITIIWFKYINVMPRKFSAALSLSRVNMESATTLLARRG